MSARGKRVAGARGKHVGGDSSLDKVLADIRAVAFWGKDKQSDEELLLTIQEAMGKRLAGRDLTELRLELIGVAAMAVLQIQNIDRQLGT